MTTLPHANLQVSFIIATHNRRDVLLESLAQIYRCGLARDAFEIFVIDNASGDGTADAVAAKFPEVLLIPLKQNLGSCAKNLALPQACGRFVVFLDDDSYPLRDSVARMIRHFERDPMLGAAVFTVHLPDGSQEASAYPNVFIGCGTGFRRRTLSKVGGLPIDFFQQAEEYDLSLRLLDAGWSVQRFDDLHAMHLKAPQSRRSDRVVRLDVRNNYILARRYFPKPWSGWFANDWTKRYRMIAKQSGQLRAFYLGLLQGVIATHRFGAKNQICDEAFESFAKVGEIGSRLRLAKERFGLRSIMLVDLGKNVLPFWIAAMSLDIEVVAIADNRLAGNQYRHLPIVNDDEAREFTFDAAIMCNINPAHAAARREQWRAKERFRPLIDLFENESLSGVAESEARQTAARIA